MGKQIFTNHTADGFHFVPKQIGLLVNSSRGILYASKGEDYVAAAAKVAASLQNQMQKLLA